MTGNIFKINSRRVFGLNKTNKKYLDIKRLFFIILFISTFVTLIPNTVHAEGLYTGDNHQVGAPISGTTNPATQASTPTPNSGHNPNCDFSLSPMAWLNCALAIVSQTVLELAAWVLMLSAMLFNALIDMTLNMKDFVTKVPIVNLGWTTFRDLTNVFFIFIILYIAINTILGNESFGIKKLLGKTIMTAILINFSLFFTQVVIDTSNIFALQFYNKIQESTGAISSTTSGSANTNLTKTYDGGISAAFVKAIGLEKIYTSNGSSASAVTNADTAAGTSNFSTTNGNTWYNIITVGIGGTFFILITAFVFLAGGFMLLIRTITLIFLMVLSPLAFMGEILPSTQGYAKKWRSKLIENALFAPAYMALLYLVASMVLTSTGSSADGTPATFTDLLLGTGDGWVTVLTTYIILNAMMVGCIVVAASIGAGGAGVANKMSKSLLGYGGAALGGMTFGAGARLGRMAIGGTADVMQERLRDSRFATTLLGRKTMGALRGVASSSFDARNIAGVGKTLGIGSGASGGHKEAREAKQKSLVEYGKTLTKNKITDYDAKNAFAEKQFGKKTMFGLIQRGNRLAGAELKVSAIDDRIKDDYTERISEIGSLITTYENTPAYKNYSKLVEKVEKQRDKVDGMAATDPKLPTEQANLARLVTQLNTARANPALSRNISYKDASGADQSASVMDITDRLKDVRTELTNEKKNVEGTKKQYKNQTKSSGINLPRRY